jgi:hypothetical protein
MGYFLLGFSISGIVILYIEVRKIRITLEGIKKDLDNAKNITKQILKG